MSPYTYDHPRPAVTVDVVVLRPGPEGVEVLLIRRGQPPFEGRWALPGGFVDMDEDLAAAAARELAEETGLTVGPLTQIGAFGEPGRDPRGRVISVAFLAMAPAGAAPRAGDDASEVRGLAAPDATELAFDHDRIVAAGLRLGGHG